MCSHTLLKTHLVTELFSVQTEIGFTALSDSIQLIVGGRRLDLPLHCTGDRNRKGRIVCLNSLPAGCSYTRKTTHLRTHRHAEHDHVHPAQWRICASLCLSEKNERQNVQRCQGRHDDEWVVRAATTTTRKKSKIEPKITSCALQVRNVRVLISFNLKSLN